MIASTEFSPPTALITGASRGLGAALAEALARDGWKLILDARGRPELERVASDLAAFTDVVTFQGDVADPSHRRDLAAAAADSGGIDALINNASILGPSPQPELLDYPIEDFERVFRINVTSPLAVIQSLAGHLRHGATIINITSDAAVEGYAGWGGYGASKAAVEQLSNVLASEHPEWRVFWVDPGDMRTRMHQEVFPGEDISDRPEPSTSVPGIIAMLKCEFTSGRYRAREVVSPGPEVSNPMKVLT